MGRFEDAVIYAANKHNNTFRKFKKMPAILHAMEVAHIISTITDDMDIIIAGLLHDVVEDSNGTLDEIKELFGKRVAELVKSETEEAYEGIDRALSWKMRKEDSIKRLTNANDRAVKILWLADKLANLRSLASVYSECGDEMWLALNQKDPMLHKWYYKTIAENLEMELNDTAAFKELIKHINYMWPGSFATEKMHRIKYKEIDLKSCRLIGKGAKSEVYRYDEETVVKVYNEKNLYKDIERENRLARMAFVAGVPTAISFGIVKVGERFGSVFELLESNSVSSLIAASPDRVDEYAAVMAALARDIHAISGEGLELPDYKAEMHAWVNGGIIHEDENLAGDVNELIEKLSDSRMLVHGDFHTGNVMLEHGEYMLIDMDSLSVGPQIAELSGIYMFYVGFGEIDPSMVEEFMGFSYETSKRFFVTFMKEYLKCENIESVAEKAAFLCYVRLVRRCYKKGIELSEKDAALRDYYMSKIYELKDKIDTLEF